MTGRHRAEPSPQERRADRMSLADPYYHARHRAKH